MTPKDRGKVQRAVRNREMVTVAYAKPGAKGTAKGGAVTRHVKPYELSVNRAGRHVLWGEDSLHPGQIHAFRTDRILAVKESEQPRKFEPNGKVAQHLRSFDTMSTPAPYPTRRTKRGR